MSDFSHNVEEKLRLRYESTHLASQKYKQAKANYTKYSFCSTSPSTSTDHVKPNFPVSVGAASPLEARPEKLRELVERNEFNPIIKVNMTGTRNPHQLLRLGSTLVGILAELTRVRLIAGNEQQRPRRDGLNVIEGVEVHELGVAGESRVGDSFEGSALRDELAAGRAVEVEELALDGGRVGRELVVGASGVLHLTALDLDPPLPRRRRNDLLPLLDALRLPQPVAVDRAHVVHARRRDGLQPRVDLGRADDERPAAADAHAADALAVDEGLRAQVVDGAAEGFGVQLGRDGVPGLARAAAPEGEVERDGDEALLGQLGDVEVGALLFDGAHGVADDDGGVGGGGGAAAEVVEGEEVGGDVGLELGLEGDGLDGDDVAGVEVVGAVGEVLRHG